MRVKSWSGYQVFKAALRGFVPTAVLCASCGWCGAATVNNLSIDLPNLTLDPSNPSSLSVDLDTAVVNSGSPFAVNGLELLVQVGDGNGNGPRITDIDLLTNPSAQNPSETPTIFGQVSNTGNRGQGDLNGNGQVFDRITSTSSGTVNIPTGSSKLGRITFDLSGVAPGTYTYSPSTTDFGPTFYTTTSPTDPEADPFLLQGGTLTVVPEPSQYAAVAALGCLGWAFVSRKLKSAKLAA